MYKFKKIILFFLLISFTFCFAQKSKKETVYLLFDTSSKKTHIVEDGAGNSTLMKEYRKLKELDYIFYYIKDELFSSHKTKSVKDTCTHEEFKNLKFVSLEYIQKAKSQTFLKRNPFEKIYLIEKLSNNKIVKIEVAWIDDWIMTKN